MTEPESYKNRPEYILAVMEKLKRYQEKLGQGVPLDDIAHDIELDAISWQRRT